MQPSRTVAGALLAALATAAPAAHAQLALPLGAAGTASPVISSKDWEAAAASVGLDAGQRQVADALFNDAQDRMFAAKRRADDDLARIDPGAEDDRSLAAEAAARRALAQAIVGEADALFQGLAPVVRDTQREALDREANAAKRRAIRAMIGAAASGATVQWDLERVVDRCALPPEAREAALAQLAPYRQRILVRLQRLLEEEIARPRRQARADGPRPAADSPEYAGIVRDLARLAESQAAVRAAKQELSAAHRDALAAIAPALGPEDMRKVEDTALSRIWPRTGVDPDSPAKAIDQLLARRATPAERAPIEQIRAAWRARWWPASVRMADAEVAMGGILSFNGETDDASRKARADFAEARADRRAADRDAWKALAAADPERREFYEGRANREPGAADSFRMPGLPDAGDAPGTVTVSSTAISVGEAAGGQDVTIEAAPVVSSVAFVVQAGDAGDGAGADSEPNVMVLDGESMGIEGGISMVMAGGGDEPILFGDRFGDGMGGGDAFAGIEFDPADADGAAVKGGIPGRMSPERVRQVASALGADPDAPSARALLDDYDAAAEAVRAMVPGIRGTKPGGTERFGAASAGEVAAIIARAMPALAAADDALISGLGAIGGADEASVGAARAERAAERLWSARHGITPYGQIRPTVAGGVFLGGCAAVPGIPEADRANARSAWAAWAPSIRAAAERAFAEDREIAPEMVEQDAAMRARFENADAANGNAIAADIGTDTFRRQGELVGRMAQASADLTRTAIAGRRAILETLSPEGKAAFDAAWLRAAAPKVYADRKDAMAALDAAYGIAGLSDDQRAQVNALRGEHAARHGELCDRLARLFVESRGGPGAPGEAAAPRDPERRTADLRFERAELNARTLRRLRSALTPEQAAAIPALSPAPTPRAPGRGSP